MEFFEVIDKRRTVRDFENEKISQVVIEKIIGAALKAPTNDHMRDWNLSDNEQQNAYRDAVPKQHKMLMEQLNVSKVNFIVKMHCFIRRL